MAVAANPERSPSFEAVADKCKLRDGVLNLLSNCVGVSAGESLLIIGEEPGLGYYDDRVCDVVAAVARQQGISTDLLRLPTVAGPRDVPESALAAMRRVDHTVFLARLGDQIRFTAVHGRCSKTMCYVLDLEYLGSAFARAHWKLFSRVHDRLVEAMSAANRYRITCPLGSSLSGDVPARDSTGNTLTAFTVKCFPPVIFPPLRCAGLRGELVLRRYLMSTSINTFEQSVVPLEQPVVAAIEDSRILGFEGDAETVARVESQYRRIGALTGGDPRAVNSWHAGIYPKTFYSAEPEADVQRWGDLAFASPRYTHFHTCGTSPGNIATATFDTTIAFDDEVYWDVGRFAFLDRPEMQALLDEFDGPFDNYEMRWDVGI